MKTTLIELIPETTEGTPTGNYDGTSLNFSGDRAKAANYYFRPSSTQTIRFITDDFIGRIEIKASLDTDPTEETDWAYVYKFPGDSTEDDSTAVSTDYATGIHGRFTWIRATVYDFLGGTVRVTMSY